MCSFHLSGDLVITLLGRFSNQFTFPHELVPVHLAALINAHFAPRFPLPLPLGRPPSLPHSRMRRSNSFLPHFFLRASALLRPIRLAALLILFIASHYKPNVRLFTIQI